MSRDPAFPQGLVPGSPPSDPCIQPVKREERDCGELCSRFRDRLGRAHLTPAHISLVRTQTPGLSWVQGEGPANVEQYSRGTAGNSQVLPQYRKGSGGTGSRRARRSQPGLEVWSRWDGRRTEGHKDKGRHLVYTCALPLTLTCCVMSPNTSHATSWAFREGLQMILNTPVLRLPT